MARKKAGKRAEAPLAQHHRELMRDLDGVARENCLRILRGGMAKSLGLRLTELKPNMLTARMALLPRHLNYNGRVNGGVIMAFADLVGAIGSAMHRPAGWRG